MQSSLPDIMSWVENENRKKENRKREKEREQKGDTLLKTDIKSLAYTPPILNKPFKGEIRR